MMASSPTDLLSQLPLFQYTPLKEGEILILHLEPGTFGDPIHARLEHVLLSDKGVATVTDSESEGSATTSGADDDTSSSYSRLEDSPSTLLQPLASATPWDQEDDNDSTYSDSEGSATRSGADHDSSAIYSEWEESLSTLFSSFEAISYAWGSSEKPHRLILGSRSVLITLSLYQALQRFRYTTYGRALWADAVCIDQNDKVEESVQVALKGEIYPAADEVLVWPGEPDGSDWLAFVIIDSMAERGPLRTQRITDDLRNPMRSCSCCPKVLPGADTYKVLPRPCRTFSSAPGSNVSGRSGSGAVPFGYNAEWLAFYVLQFDQPVARLAALWCPLRR